MLNKSDIPAAMLKCLTRDRKKLEALYRQFCETPEHANNSISLSEKLEQLIERSSSRVAARAQQLPRPQYDGDLPVVEQRQAILQAVQENQVVIVAGETGSGKTTQLPKMCIELKRGSRGLIGHTQPRRIAARSVASRIASELDVDLGKAVGYQVRFQDRCGEQTCLKLMTDGILLAEIQHDPLLDNYDTIIIDEAHERGLNIDFLLGYLKQLLPKRPDLKLIITSATIDTEKFSSHFRNAPVIQAAGRSYPVETIYQPLLEVKSEKDQEQMDGVLEAVDRLKQHGPGGILVFLASEREIRETADHLKKHYRSGLDILPLFSRLSTKDQDLIFGQGKHPRVVLSTNVAETSLTVPGIRYVIDAGKARISRYSLRHKVQRLPVEKVSQASANQRKGRCGRLGPGICIRLYDETDFLNRAEYTEPEILRTNLAAVILRMLSLGIGEIESFDFIDPPDRKQINDGYRLLFELGAVTEDRLITTLGRQMSRFPLDPRLSRMLIAAGEEGCLAEIMVITSFLSIQDPRERPYDYRQKADEAHSKFSAEASDFLSCLNLWNFYQEQSGKLSGSQMRKLCKTSFLSWPRIREWIDLHTQLKYVVKDMKLTVNSSVAASDNVHRALLSGLLGFVGTRQNRHEYLGGHNKQFFIMPGSCCFSQPPQWLMAAEIVETTKVYARMVAAIDNQWLETAAAHLLRKSWAEPWWSKRQGRAMVTEKATLYGMVVYADRQVSYATVDSLHARRIFIEQGLVARQYFSHTKVLKENFALLKRMEELEEKVRKPGALIDEIWLYQFYNERIDKEVVDGKTFEQWAKGKGRDQLAGLQLSDSHFEQQRSSISSEARFPESLLIRDNRIRLLYQFNPGSQQDGVTALLPQVLLSQLKAEDFEYLVPGLLEEKIIALIKSLPKGTRKHFVPAPDFAKACMETMVPGMGGLLQQLGAQLQRMTGVRVRLTDWAPDKLPGHLRIYFKVVDADGNAIAESTEFDLLKADVKPDQGVVTEKNQVSLHNTLDSQSAASASVRVLKRIESWDFGDLQQQVSRQEQGVNLQFYPSLRETTGGEVELIECYSQQDANELITDGMTGLFRRIRAKDVKYIEKNIPQMNQLALLYAPLGKQQDLKQQLVRSIARRALLSSGKQLADIRTQQAFEELAQEAATRLVSTSNEYSKRLNEILKLYQQVATRLTSADMQAFDDARDDIEQQLSSLFDNLFPYSVTFENLVHYPRYMTAISRRLDKLFTSPARDQALHEQITNCEQLLVNAIEQYGDLPAAHDTLDHLRWMIQEMRVSLFAQELKTAFPVSLKRMEKQIDKLKQFTRVGC